MNQKTLAIAVLFILVATSFTQVVSSLRYGNNTNPTNSDGTFWGAANNDNAGTSSVILGDINGDGLQDIAYSAPGHSSNTGEVYIFFGKTSGWHTGITLTSADASYVGENQGDKAGSWIAGVGDVNGDGFGDFMIGSPFASGPIPGDGKVYLILGHPGIWNKDVNLQSADGIWTGESDGDGIGTMFAGVGDVNGDGKADILVGAPYAECGATGDLNRGCAYLIFGRASNWGGPSDYLPITTMANATFKYDPAWGINLGLTVAGLGDINGDGYDDFAIAGAGNQNEGYVDIYYGRQSGWMAGMDTGMADIRFQGKIASAYVGNSMAGEDLNNDGLSDIIIGAPAETTANGNSGRVYLVKGQSAQYPARNMTLASNATGWIDGDQNGEAFGWSVTAAGDVNGDGYNDIAVGAHAFNSGGSNTAGKVYLFLGNANIVARTTDASTSASSWLGEGNNDHLGYSLGGPGDVNGDGYDDIVMGAIYHNGGGHTTNGKGYLLFPDKNFPPGGGGTIKVFSDANYSSEVSSIRQFDKAYLQYSVPDANASHIDTVMMNISSDLINYQIKVPLIETGPNTGIFQGSITISNRTSQKARQINADPGGWFSIYPCYYTTPFTKITVDWSLPILVPATDNGTAFEDKEYSQTYTVLRGKPSYAWKLQGPAWMQKKSNGDQFIINGTPQNNNVGNAMVTIWVNDSAGSGVKRSFRLTVLNTPPEILGDGNITATEGVRYSGRLQCDDDGQGNMLWDAPSMPAWLSYSHTTGIMNGTPGEADVGKKFVNISVTDDHNGVSTKKFNITVININEPPVITSDPILNATEKVQYLYQVLAKDSDAGTIINYSLDIAPNGMTIVAHNGSIRWTPRPDQWGINQVVVNVTDGVNYVHQRFNITVKIFPPVSSLKTPTNGSIVDTQTPTLTWVTNDPNDQTVWVDIYLSSIWQDVSSHSASALVTHGIEAKYYTPTGPLNRNTTYFWTVVPTDGSHTGICDNGMFRFTVNRSAGDHPPQIHGSPPTKVMAGSKYSYAVTAHDPDVSDILTYSLTKAPPGMQIIHNSGEITWMTKATDVGNYSVIIRVSDGILYVEQNFTLEVMALPVNHLPLIQTIPVQKATVGKAFTYQVHASDQDKSDTLNYSFQDSPPGASIDSTGLIHWTPTSAQTGSQSFMVRVSDGKNWTDIKFTVNVPKPTTSSSGPPMLMILLLVLVLAVVIAIIAAALIMSKRKKAKAQVPKEEVFAAPVQTAVAPVSQFPAKETVEDFTIEGAFLIYQDGRLMAKSTTTEASVDDQLFSSMLIAIQGFVRESFKADSCLDSFEFSGRHVVVVKGRYIFLAVSLSGKEPPVLRDRMTMTVEKFEGTYAGVIERWDGNVDTFAPAAGMLTPLFAIKDEYDVKKAQEEVRVLSSLEFYEGFVRLKVAVMNKTGTTITDSSLNLTYNMDALKFNKIEPELQHEGTNVRLGAVKPGEKKTVAYYLDPLICQESVVDCTLTFYDFKGDIRHVNMKRRPVDIVCPIFYTTATVNVAMLKRLLGDLQYHDSKLYRITDLETMKNMYESAKQAVSAHAVKLVREFIEGDESEAWFYGEVSESAETMVIRVSVHGGMKVLEVYVASSNLATQTGLLAELGIKINTKVKAAPTQVQVETSPELKAVIERSKLLLEKYAEAEVAPADGKPS